MSQVKTTDKAIRRNLSKQINQIFWSIKKQLFILFFLSELLEFNEFHEFNEFIEFNECLDNDKQLRYQQVNMTSDESQEEMSQSLFMCN